MRSIHVGIWSTRVYGALVAGAILVCEPATAQQSVTTCGETVNGSARLIADLDCSTYDGVATIFLLGGTLDFDGHVLTVGAGVRDAVLCVPPCEIYSTSPGGGIQGPAEAGIAVREASSKPLTLSDIFVDGTATGVYVTHYTPVEAFRISISRCAGDGIHANRIRLSDSDIGDNGGRGVGDRGIAKFDIRGSRIHDNRFVGIEAVGYYGYRSGGQLRLATSEVSGNGVSDGGGNVIAHRVKIMDSLITGGGGGVWCRAGGMLRTVVRDTGGSGIIAVQSFMARRSEIRANVSDGIRSDYTSYRPGDGRLRVLESGIIANGGDGISNSGNSSLRVHKTTIVDNALSGIALGRGAAKIVGSTIRANATSGVLRPPDDYCENAVTELADSSVRENGWDASCGVEVVCADLATCDFPVVAATACDTSYDSSSGVPGLTWGICALD